MADERKYGKKWSLEEIDELLQDSGMLPKEEPIIESAPVRKAEAINPRPVRNEDIDHQIISEKIERSEGSGAPQVYGAFVSEKYRDRFFNRPIQNLEKTAEHPIVPEEEQKYERSGFVKKKSSFENTADLSPVPTLVPDDRINEKNATDKTVVFEDAKDASENDKYQEAKTRTIGLRSLAVTDGNAHEHELDDEYDDSQLTLEGFHTPEVNIVDEREVEEELIKKRKVKASTFTITSDITGEDKTDSPKRYGTDEYRTPDDKFKVSYYLKKNKNTSFAGMVASYICFGVLTALSIFAMNFPETEKGVLIASLVAVIITIIANADVLLDGLRSFKGMKFGKNTGSVISVFAALVQNIVFLFSSAEPFENGLALLTAAAVLPIAFNRTAEYFEYKRIAENFEYISNNELYSIGKIEKKQTAFEIGRGLLLEDPNVLASQKTSFPRRFIELSQKFYPSDDINRRLVPISFGASVLVGAITLLITKDTLSSITAFTGAVSVSVPYFSYLVDALIISKNSKKLLEKGGMIAGWDAFNECSKANAIAFDSADVFDENGGNVFGIHPFYDIQIDEAILYTASLLVKSGGPLGNLFKRIIVGETSLLPPVDSLTYEDKLGLSAWIFNRRILVGSSDLLRNHNVVIPDMALIERHLCEGRYPLYLSVDGKAAAVFIVSYDINTDNARLLKAIEKNSISLLVRSDDANITDEMVSSRLSLPQSGVKVLSAVSGDIYKSYCAGVTSAADALLMHDGKPSSFLSAINSALSLGSVKHILNIFQACAMGIGLAVVSALAFVSGLSSLNCIQLIVVQGFFSAFTIFAMNGSLVALNGSLKKQKNKNKLSKKKSSKKKAKKKKIRGKKS